jgi:2-oxoglutarate ferredoxin oxidoreductase subunit alpha
MEKARTEGLKVGMVRPITLWPFPARAFAKVAEKAKAFVVVELSAGQMVEDVELAVRCKKPVHFYGRTGGMMPSPKEIYEEIFKAATGKGER